MRDFISPRDQMLMEQIDNQVMTRNLAEAMPSPVPFPMTAPENDPVGFNRTLASFMPEPTPQGMRRTPASEAEIKQEVSMRDSSSMPMTSPIPKNVSNQYAQRAQKEETDRYKKYMDMREKLIGNANDRMKILNDGYTPQLDLTPLLQYADNMGQRTNIASGYKRPETFEERQAMLQQIENQTQGNLGQMVNAEMNYQSMENRKIENERDRMLKMQLLNQKNAEKDKGKILTASETANLADVSAQSTLINDMYDSWEKAYGNASKVGGLAASKVWGTEANMYEDQRKLSAQAIGKSLEGGKLTDVDYDKYLNMLPKATDTKEQAKRKIKSLKSIMAKKYNSSLDSYKRAGYDMSGFEELSPDTKKPKSQTVNYTNDQAIKWLEANPNHPKAQAVRQKLGL